MDISLSIPSRDQRQSVFEFMKPVRASVDDPVGMTFKLISPCKILSMISFFFFVVVVLVDLFFLIIHSFAFALLYSFVEKQGLLSRFGSWL